MARLTKIVKNILIVLIVLNKYSISIAGSNYYVDANIMDTHISSPTPDYITYDHTTYKTTGGNDRVYKTLYDINKCSFSGGDTIYFRRGQIWRGELVVPSSGSSGNSITFSAFGSGDDPIIMGSTSFNDIDDWTEESSNIWYTTDPNFDSNPQELVMFGYESESNVGTLVGDCSTHKKDLDTAREFCCDLANDRVYTYCTQNPATEYHSIEIPTVDKIINITNKSYITITGLHIKYTQSLLIVANNSDHIIIDSNTGSWGGGDTVGGGNGFQLGYNTTDSYIRNNTLSQVYDYGIGVHNYGTKIRNTTNNYVYGNTVDRCSGGVTISSTCKAACTINNINVYENHITNSGYGWAGYDRVGQGANGGGIIQTQSSGATVNNIYIYKNKIDTYAGSGIRINGGKADVYYNLVKNGMHDAVSDYRASLEINGGACSVSGNFYYNLIYNNERYGILIINNEASPTYLYNNTLYDNGDSTHANIRSWSSDYEIIKNNIIFSTDSLCFEDDLFGRKATLNYNCYYRASGDLYKYISSYDKVITDWQKKYPGANDSNSIQADPVFVNPPTNLSLRSESPCIDIALNLGNTYVFALAPISTWPESVITLEQGPKWEIGAYPYYLKPKAVQGLKITDGSIQ